jgi:hypothetical protein
VAAEKGTPELLQKVWESEDISNKFLLAPDSEGKTIWHVAAKWDKTEILQKIWERLKWN